LYCLFLLTIVFSFSVDPCIVRQYNGQQKKTIQGSTEKDNTRVNRKRQYNGQQEKTIQGSTEKDNRMVNRKIK
jgi:hypothetical protein